MPYYRLWRQPDNTWHGPVNARDDGHAVAIFSEQLGITLTLEEGPLVATYMMARRDRQEPERATWAKDPDIPVWVKDPAPSN